MRIAMVALGIVMLVLHPCATTAASKVLNRHELRPIRIGVDAVGSETMSRHIVKAVTDTIWIANWSFDLGGACSDEGWVKIDNLIKNDGSLFWSVDDRLAGLGNLEGQSAILGHHDLCWVFPDGYDNDWYQALLFEYLAPSYLSFDYVIDSESGFDFLQVEVDSGCASFELAEGLPPWRYRPEWFRDLLFSVSGFDTLGSVDSLLLGDLGAPGATHCAYVSFWSDGAWAPSDGLQPTALRIAAAIDNLVVVGTTNITEDFEDTLDPTLSFVNLYDTQPFGEWARVYPHITDNDACSENHSCAWLWTDDTTPTLANDPSMAFAPGSYVVLNWLDDIVVSPWVSLASTSSSNRTVLTFRRFPGNSFSTSRIVQNWSVRGKTRIANSDTPSPGDSLDCVSTWGHAFNWNSLSAFRWIDNVNEMTDHFDAASREIQIRFRVSDWQWISGAAPPTPHIPGPGPFNDRVRIGRFASGPGLPPGPLISEGIDSRSQAQDAFPTFLNGITPGEHYSPSQDRFGTAAFSQGADLGINSISPNVITGDSIHVEVLDVSDAGGIVRVEWHGAVVAGPHAGKAPPPWNVGPNGFFVVPADSVRNEENQVVENHWFVDVDDDYFRGGDQLVYFWLAEDAAGLMSSNPAGLDDVPLSVEAAQIATDGLMELNFLPTLAWDASYLDRIAADPHGDFPPTPLEIANSSQATCLLYVQLVNDHRRSGDLHRTSFMYTLDQLGYEGLYDVYDVQGLGNTNNQLAGRATEAQATGYAVIVFDAGNAATGTPLMPDGSDLDLQKVDQMQWFRNWLARASQSEAGTATLWLLGANLVEEHPFAPLYTQDMALGYVSGNQGLAQNPLAMGQASFAFSNGTTVDFAGNDFALAGNTCGLASDYDALDAVSSGVVTHRWSEGSALGDGAVVMNADASRHWNTITMAFPWFDIHNTPVAPTEVGPEELLAEEILEAVLPAGCAASTPTHVPNRTIENRPTRTALYANTPNPFNPATTIRFDLDRECDVRLVIYDVAGRQLCALVRDRLPRGRHSTLWDGRNDFGGRVSSGVYFYRLQANSISMTRKLMLLR